MNKLDIIKKQWLRQLLPNKFSRPTIRQARLLFEKNQINALEIGVNYGFNALSMEMMLNIKDFYLIDPYKTYVNYTDMDTSWDPKYAYKIAEKSLRKFKNTTFFIGTAKKMIANVPNNTIHVCYIDGNHDESFVYDDIRLAYPKIMDGGIIGGHNYEAKYPGVSCAVDRYFGKKRVKQAVSDWWVFKKEDNK